MAFYLVTFEGKKYMSRDLFTALHNTTSFSLPKLGRMKSVLDTLVFGPVSAEEIKKAETSGFEYETQDFDAQIASIAKADGTEQTLKFVISVEDVIAYKTWRFVKLAKIKDPRKYRLIDRLPVVKVCGHNSYVCLNAKNKDTANPIVVCHK